MDNVRRNRNFLYASSSGEHAMNTCEKCNGTLMTHRYALLSHPPMLHKQCKDCYHHQYEWAQADTPGASSTGFDDQFAPDPNGSD